MKIPAEILRLRNELKSGGDNILIAEIATASARRIINARSVSSVIGRKQGQDVIVRAIADFYFRKAEFHKHISKSAKRGLQSLSNIEMAQ